MHEGLYESVLTSGLASRLDALPGLEAEIARVDPADQTHVLTRYLADAIQVRLDAERDPDLKVALANTLLHTIRDQAESVESPVRELFTLRRPPIPGSVVRLTRRPKTPLNDAALLTNAHGEPSLASELKAEIDSADSVDLLCAFVMWRGVRLLEGPLAQARRAGVSFRVVTTTYIGGTEREAPDRLVRDFGAEVKIQYNAARTRLHAKAWLFRRSTGFDTAYVGSSNLSTSALLEGVEWNVRLSKSATPTLLTKFAATFDTHWNSPDFEPYDPDHDRDRLDDALAEARAGGRRDRVTISISGLEVRPYPYQQEMLDALEAERLIHDRHQNLVVAATGTGKTVVAALDYHRMCAESSRPSYSSLPIAERFWSSRFGPTAKCWAMETSGSCTLAALVPSVGSTCSRACNR
jgi:HKD family nuclease